jgi:hypothetical protein
MSFYNVSKLILLLGFLNAFLTGEAQAHGKKSFSRARIS